MFNFWPFNVARKRREREEAEAQVQPWENPVPYTAEERAYAGAKRAEFLEKWADANGVPKDHPKRPSMRNKVVPMDDPGHPRNLTPEQRQRIKEREGERQAVIQRDRDAWARHEWQSRQRTETSAPAADDLHTIGSPLSVWHPAHPIHHSSPAPESRCDSPSDSSSYDPGSTSCSTD